MADVVIKITPAAFGPFQPPHYARASEPGLPPLVPGACAAEREAGARDDAPSGLIAEPGGNWPLRAVKLMAAFVRRVGRGARYRRAAAAIQAVARRHLQHRYVALL